MLRLKILFILFLVALALCAFGLRRAHSQIGTPARITVTSEERTSLHPTISGDGRHIVFESTANFAGNGGPARFHAVRADIANDAATLTQIADTRAVTPAVSRDGTRIAFASNENILGTNADGNSEIYLYDGASVRQITNTTPGNISDRLLNGNFQPSISADGRFIAFHSNRDPVSLNADANFEIFIYDTTAQSFTQLTDTNGAPGASMARLSGDASSLAFIRDNGSSTNPQRELVLQNRINNTTRIIAQNFSGLNLTGGRAISDDGARIVFAAETAANKSQVFLFDARSNTTRQITSLDARADDVPLNPTISGDGLRLSFATRRNINGGNSDHSVELYLFDIPTARLSQLTHAPSNATAEVVSSLNDDGSIVAFNFPRALSGAVSSNEAANNSEIYLAQTPARPAFSGNLTILNGASFGNEPATTKAVAPASIAVARGDALAFNAAEADRLANKTFPTTLAGTSVTVNNRAAQIFFVSPSQINFLVPLATEQGAAEVVVTNSEGFQTRGTVLVQNSAPGIFTTSGDGRGEGLTLDADTLALGPFDPTGGARRLIVFATGVRGARAQTEIFINGRAAQVETVVASQDLPGLDEIHIRLPDELRGAGAVDFFIRADNQESNAVNVTFAGEARHDIIINEVLADPPGSGSTDLAGDANRDGSRSASQDEFIEMVNATSQDTDIGGYQIFTRATSATNDTLRHTFAPGTLLPAGTGIVVFGGASPATFNPQDPAFGGAQVLTASSGSLSLINAGGVVTLRESAGELVAQVSYGGSTGLDGNANQSLTRSPDIAGRFVLHQSATGSAGRVFSPGTRVDGSPFIATPAITRIEVSPLAQTINTGAQQQFMARAFDAVNQELSGVIFRWQSSAGRIATIDDGGLARGLVAGTTEIRATARGVQSAPAVLTVQEPQRILTRIELMPAAATIPVGGTLQFDARGFDQNNLLMTGLVFNWSTTNQGIATIDQTGNATALQTGTTAVNVSAQSVLSQTINASATLNVVASTVVINEALADPPGSVLTDLAGDANHDGARSSSEDEFIELVNSTAAAQDISGWTIRTRSLTGATETTRHTFAANTTLPAGDAVVVFGGGQFDVNHPAFGGARIFRASTSGLSLTNSGLNIILRDAAGNMVAQFSYGGSTNLNGDDDQSLTRSPDIVGNFTRHTQAAGANGRLFSPGTKTDGSFFVPRAGRLTSLNLTPTSASVFIDQTTAFNAQALDQFGRALPGINIAFTSSDTSIATVEIISADPQTGVVTATLRGQSSGTVQLIARANDGANNVMSNLATLSVAPAPPRVNRVEVAPQAFSINRGGSLQFTATAFDQNNQLVPGAVFNWSTSLQAIATIDQSGLARGTGIGAATVNATTSDGAGGMISGQATLAVQVPLIINEILADVPPDNPSTTDVEGDANRDGVRSADDDEFVELFNNSTSPVDISGVIVADATSNRFTFPANTVLEANRAVLIYGGGNSNVNDNAFGGALVLKTSSLGLNDTGDTVTVKLTVAGTDVSVATQTFGAGGPTLAPADQSLTRSPDAETNTTGGNFVAHMNSANAAARAYSPGTRTDGTPFGSTSITRVEIAPASVSINVGAAQSFTARAFINTQGGETEIQNVSFIWDSSDANKATLAPTLAAATTAHGIAAGNATIRVRVGGGQATATFVVNPVVASIDLTPDSATTTVGNSATFNATAREANGNAIPNLTFTFSLRNPTPANAASITAFTSETVTVSGDQQGAVAVVANYTRPDGMIFEDSSLLNITLAPPHIARVEISPSNATINRGGSQPFNATAFDQNNQIVPNAIFNWSTDNAAIATVDQSGQARGIGIGMATITASTSDGAGGPVSSQATLNIQVPLVINEILADPAGSVAVDLQGDANRDGARDSDDDEFVELLNNSNSSIDISGVVISDATSNRFTFPSNTTLAAGRSVVIFGGGSPPANDPAFGGALIATTNTLSLNNGGDTVTVKLVIAGVDTIIAAQAYGAEGGNDQSLTRAPDAEVGTTGGAFTQHTSAVNAAARLFSPGTRLDGTPFGSPAITRIEITPTVATLDIGATQTFNARAFTNTSGAETEIQNVSFVWASTDASKATVSIPPGASTVATAIAAGSAMIQARAGGQSGAATLNINQPPPVLTRIDLTPTSATIIVGATQQFSATAFDQNNQIMPGIAFNWASSNMSAATINQSGLASGISNGAANITASSGNVTSNTALLNVTPPPPVPTAGQVIINEAVVSFATSGTQTRNDFLELYNTTSQPLDISGLVISFRASGNTSTVSTVTLPGTMGSSTTIIPAQGYFLVVNGADTFGVMADFNASALGLDLNNTTGGIKIEVNGVKLDGLLYQGGSSAPPATFNTFGEGVILTFTSGTTNDLIRSPNATDTNNNFNDFRRNGTAASVTPKSANPTLP